MLYPPSDFVAQTIPADLPRLPGCGREHRRPTGPDGVPVHPWALSCELCEAWIRENDDRWSPTPMEIKPTFDEAREAEHLKTHVDTTRDQIMLAALAKIAGLPLPDSVARGLPVAAAVTALLACPSCSSAQPSGSCFCGACGSPMRTAAPAAAITGGIPA